MKNEQSLVTRVIRKLKWFFLALLIFIVEQLPLLFIQKNQPLWQILLLASIIIVMVGGVYYLARRINLLGNRLLPKDDDRFLWIMLGTLALFVVKLIGGFLLVLENGQNANTANQAAIENAQLHPIFIVLILTIMAPVVEEIVFRGLLYGKLFGTDSYVGLVFSSILFGLIHMLTDLSSLGSWFIYGGMGLVLGFIYHKTKKLEYTILVHFLNNGIAVLLMWLLPYLTKR
ncbi:CPBP family intramembrane glutamic endopeptidase [Streptococcus phocae subsp. phocae]